jgi:hypothetical protein
MERYTVVQRIEIVKIHYKNGESFAETVRKVRTQFGHHEAPSRSAIVKIIKIFEQTGFVTNQKKSGRPRTARSTENLHAVEESVDNDPGMSIPRRSQQLNISTSSLHRILHLDLHLHPYKVQLTQELKPADHLQRRAFSNWVLEMQATDDDFCNKIILSDEAHFYLNGYVNKQNCRI